MSTPTLYKRMASWMYEGLLLFAICAITGLIYGYLTNSTHALAHRLELQVLLFLVIGCYFTWFWSKGQTLAMKTWRFKIVGANGSHITKQRAAARYLLSWLWFFPPLLALAFTDLSKARLFGTLAGWLTLYLSLALQHPSKQFLHDRLAGTRLVNA